MLPNWNSEQSITGAHQILAAYALFAFAVMVIIELLAHRETRLKHRLEKLALYVFALAIALEISDYVYGRRSDTLTQLRIAVLNQEAGDARRVAAEAHADAAKSELRASALEEKAATLEKQAADERLQQARMEAVIQPRTLSVAEQKRLIGDCKQFSGLALTVTSFGGDAESSRLSAQIADVLKRANLKVADRTSGRMAVNMVPPSGITIYRYSIDRYPDLAAVIAKDLTDAHLVGGVVPGDPLPGEGGLEILVGLKPVPRS